MNITRTGFEHHFSQLFRVRGFLYRDGPFVRNVSFVETQEKCYSFKIEEQSLQRGWGILLGVLTARNVSFNHSSS